MLQTSIFLRKTIIHPAMAVPVPDPTVLIERVTETRDSNSGHVSSAAAPLPPGYVGADDEEKLALARLVPMPSGHRVALVGRGWRGTQEEYDRRSAGAAGVQSPAHAALVAAQVKAGQGGPAKPLPPEVHSRRPRWSQQGLRIREKANAAQAAALQKAMRPLNVPSARRRA